MSFLNVALTELSVIVAACYLFTLNKWLQIQDLVHMTAIAVIYLPADNGRGRCQMLSVQVC